MLRNRITAAVIAFLTLMTGTAASGNPEVGETLFKRGTVHVNAETKNGRTLELKDPIYRNDTLETAARSFAVVRFTDNNRLSVRPNSRVEVAAYLDDAEQAGTEVNLEAGGLRARIDKKAQRTYRVNAGEVKVETQDAMFDLRHCGTDCREENLQLARQGPILPESAVGRAALLRGEISARDESGEIRMLRLNGPVFEKEQLTVGKGSAGMLVFLDGGRLSLDSNSKVVIESMRHGKSAGGGNSARLKLLEGGVRVLTGLIGKESPESFKVESPVATTGIRGTGFDMYCYGSCSSQEGLGAQPDLEHREGNWPDGLYTNVWEGQISQANDAGDHPLRQGQTQYIGNRTSGATRLPKSPEFLEEMDAPRPDGVSDKQLTLVEDASTTGTLLTEAPPGTYLHVYRGTVKFYPAPSSQREEDDSESEEEDTEPREVSAGMTMYASPDGHLMSASGAPSFMAQDAGCP